MKDVIEELIKITSEQVRCVNELLRLSEEETEALKKNDVSLLSKFCGKMNEEAQKLVDLEGERAQVCGKLASFLGIPENASFGELKRALSQTFTESSDEIDELFKKTQSLKLAYTRLQEQNSLNRQLLKQSLSYVREIQEAFGLKKRSLYGRDGEYGSISQESTLLNREV
ncbi:MAG: flagellar protein FlgN [Clostridia bacterium]|nr:flagellar protein FlgN [Clostridia bacterium]